MYYEIDLLASECHIYLFINATTFFRAFFVSPLISSRHNYRGWFMRQKINKQKEKECGKRWKGVGKKMERSWRGKGKDN